MKLFTLRTYCVLALVLFSSIGQVNSQNFSVNVTTDTIAFSIDTLPNIDVFKDTAANSPFRDHYAYWQIFWVTGDGNYYFRQGEMYYDGSTTTPPTPAPPSVPYSFLHEHVGVDSMKYKPVALLIDRKTDNPPPPPAIVMYTNNPGTDPRDVTLPNSTAHGNDLIYYTSPSVLANPVSVEDSTKRIYLKHSHSFLKNNRWSGFITGYRPEQEGRLLLFYPEDLKDSVITHIPNYTRDTAQRLVYSSAVASTKYGTDTNYTFVTEYVIEKGELSYDLSTDGIEELRLFNFLKADTSLFSGRALFFGNSCNE